MRIQATSILKGAEVSRRKSNAGDLCRLITHHVRANGDHPQYIRYAPRFFQLTPSFPLRGEDWGKSGSLRIRTSSPTSPRELRWLLLLLWGPWTPLPVWRLRTAKTRAMGIRRFIPTTHFPFAQLLGSSGECRQCETTRLFTTLHPFVSATIDTLKLLRPASTDVDRRLRLAAPETAGPTVWSTPAGVKGKPPNAQVSCAGLDLTFPLL